MRIIAVAALILLAAAARAEDRLHALRFAPGTTSASVKGDLESGDSDLYTFSARAGQTAEIRLSAADDNADLMIYRPPVRLARRDDTIDVQGPVLDGGEPVPGLDPGATRHWQGTLPASGEYLIVVVSDRGDATYELAVRIR